MATRSDDGKKQTAHIDADPTSPGADDDQKFPNIDQRMLRLLVCPLTRTALHYDAARSELVSRAARLAFPIRSGVPLLIEDAARPLAEDE